MEETFLRLDGKTKNRLATKWSIRNVNHMSLEDAAKALMIGYIRTHYPLLAGEDTQRQAHDKEDRPHNKATPLMLIVCDFALFLDHAQSVSCIGDGRSVGELMSLVVPLVELWAQRWGYDDI